VVTLYQRFLAAAEAASRAGITAEDLTHGHALSADQATRDIQLQFEPVAKNFLPELRHVLRDSSDEAKRATAVYVLAYAPDKSAAIDDLQFALRDADPGVRANATRGLKALAVFAHLSPEAHLKIEPTWFIEMLNSLSWSDRNQALAMLLTLTDDGNPSALDQIRERAFPSLVEMAQWKSLTHALPAFLLLGRVAGLSDLQVHEAWTRGDRKSVIAAATAKKKK
jgi:HEAT repeat protein